MTPQKNTNPRPTYPRPPPPPMPTPLQSSAQQKPLTLHEIVKLTQGLDLNGISWVDVIRAVEAAHGIKD